MAEDGDERSENKQITVKGGRGVMKGVFKQFSSTSQCEEPVCSRCIPSRVLMAIDGQMTRTRGYISVANDYIVDEVITLDCNSQRLEETFRKRAQHLTSRVRRVSSGCKREDVLDGDTHIFVLHSETVSRSELLGEHNAAVEAAELYKLQVENLQETLDELREEMVREKAHMAQEMTGMEERLAHFITPVENSGRTLEQLGPRQAKRKLGEFRNRAQVALFFAHSIGLNPHSLEVSTTSGKAMNVQLDAAESASVEPSISTASSD